MTFVNEEKSRITAISSEMKGLANDLVKSYAGQEIDISYIENIDPDTVQLMAKTMKLVDLSFQLIDACDEELADQKVKTEEISNKLDRVIDLLTSK